MFQSSLSRFNKYVFALVAFFSPAQASTCSSADFDKQLNYFTDISNAANIFKGNPKVFVVNKNSMNAFALKDGRIVFTTRIIEAFENNGEFYSILLHEIGHHLLGHFKAGEKITDFEPLLGSGLGDIVNLYSLGQMSQAQEKEADAFAVTALANLGFDPRLIISALGKIDRGQANVMDLLFGSHPVGDLRKDALLASINGLKKVQISRHVEKWPKFHWSCK
jgi:predicted Zn-dependent protease